MTGLVRKAAVYTKAYPRVYSRINTRGSPTTKSIFANRREYLYYHASHIFIASVLPGLADTK